MTVQSYFLPTSVPEALGLLGAHGPELQVLAGGTVVMAMVNEGVAQPTKVMGLRRAGLDAIERAGDEVTIGAMVTLAALTGLDDLPLLQSAALRTGAWAVRNMATIGGNLFIPSPGGDVAVALLALDARVVITGAEGPRIVPIAEFWTGWLSTVVARDELVTSIVVPVAERAEAFVKFGRRNVNTHSVVTVAARATLEGGTATDVRIALGAAGPHPVRAARAEAVLEGRPLDEMRIAEAAAAAASDCDPMTDAVATSDYRRRMVGVFVRRALGELAGGATGREA